MIEDFNHNTTFEIANLPISKKYSMINERYKKFIKKFSYTPTISDCSSKNMMALTCERTDWRYLHDSNHAKYFGKIININGDEPLVFYDMRAPHLYYMFSEFFLAKCIEWSAVNRLNYCNINTHFEYISLILNHMNKRGDWGGFFYNNFKDYGEFSSKSISKLHYMVCKYKSWDSFFYIFDFLPTREKLPYDLNIPLDDNYEKLHEHFDKYDDVTHPNHGNYHFYLADIFVKKLIMLGYIRPFLDSLKNISLTNLKIESTDLYFGFKDLVWIMNHRIGNKNISSYSQ